MFYHLCSKEKESDSVMLKDVHRAICKKKKKQTITMSYCNFNKYLTLFFSGCKLCLSGLHSLCILEFKKANN